MCTACDPVVHYYVRDYVCCARVFGGINFGDLVKNSPIRQIKIPAKVSSYTVYISNNVQERNTAIEGNQLAILD